MTKLFRDISTLKFDPANSRKHDERNIKAIMDSLQQHGQRKPIVIYSDMVVAGNGTLEAAKRLGWTEIWVNNDPFPSLEAAKAYALQDNRSAELAAWDDVQLGDTLSELKEAGYDLEGLGWNDGDLKSIMSDKSGTEGLTDPDQVPEVAQNEFGVKRGDIWQLGNHRLMCGDSTLKEDVEKLMNGEKADMVFTDPPYGGNVGGLKPYTGMEALQRKKDGKSLVYQDRTILNDDKIDWLEKVFQILPVKKENSTKMVFFKWDAFEKIKIFCKCWGEPSALLVWDRVKRANNFFRFQPQHELIFHWGNQADKREKSSLSNVFSIQKDETEIHPTVKPIDLLDPIIRVCSSNDELILDPFLGSGSTLIACEKTGRKCYGMELDEHYCSVIIKRWQDFTGKKAERIVEGA